MTSSSRVAAFLCIHMMLVALVVGIPANKAASRQANTSSANGCVDKNRNCKLWFGRGLCQTSQYMRETICRHTCGECNVALVRGKYSRNIKTSQIQCTENSIGFFGTPFNFPKYRGSELMLGTCPLRDNFTVVAAIEQCGLQRITEVGKGHIIGVLKSPQVKAVIRRRMPVYITIKCTYSSAPLVSAQSAIRPNIGVITGELLYLRPIDLHLNLLNSDNGRVIASGNDLEVFVGQTITAEVNGRNLAVHGMYAYAQNCHATPDSDWENDLQWQLVEDFCPMDTTVTITPYNINRGQRITFESFSFSDDIGAKVYLHCDLVACTVEQQCGVCDKPDDLQDITLLDSEPLFNYQRKRRHVEERHVEERDVNQSLDGSQSLDGDPSSEANQSDVKQSNTNQVKQSVHYSRKSRATQRMQIKQNTGLK